MSILCFQTRCKKCTTVDTAQHTPQRLDTTHGHNAWTQQMDFCPNMAHTEGAVSPAEGSAPASPPPLPEGPACGRWGSQRPGSCWHSPSEPCCLASAGPQSTPPPPAAAPALHTHLLSANLIVPTQKRKGGKTYAFRRQLSEKPSVLPGCPALPTHTLHAQLCFHGVQPLIL